DQSEYEKAIEKLSEGIEIVSDSWFNDLDPIDQGNLLGKWGGLNDPTAKYIGSWGGYRIFTGKFKNVSTRRIANGFGVAFTHQTGSFVYPEQPNRRNIPPSVAIHGDMPTLKAFLRISSMYDNNIVGVLYNRFRTKYAVINEVDNLPGEQS
ncbi:hypothetical protein, partial [Nitrosomonas supralitoralis]